MGSGKIALVNIAVKDHALTRIIVLAVLLLVGCSQPPALSQTPSAVTPTSIVTISSNDEIETRIQAVERGYIDDFPTRMKYYQVPGVSIAVINHGVIEWARGYGVVDTNTTQSITEDTLFQAASISKPLVAMATLYYVQTGVLNLDEDVNHKLLSWKVPDNEYTRDSKVILRGLLSHSAGLTVHGFAGYTDKEEIPTLLQILDGEPPANSDPIRVFVAPGTLWQYSGGGYVVAQQLLEDVTDKPFPEIMRDTVLQKLEMGKSTFAQPLPPSLSQLAAVGHTSNSEIVNGKWHIYPEIAAAGLWTTPSDLARFVIEIQQSVSGKSNRILSKEIAEQMVTRQFGEWGLGLQVGGSGDDAWFAHGGANEGFRCYMFGFIKNGQGAVVMTNSDNGYELALEIIRTISLVYEWPSTPQR